MRGGMVGSVHNRSWGSTVHNKTEAVTPSLSYFADIYFLSIPFLSYLTAFHQTIYSRYPLFLAAIFLKSWDQLVIRRLRAQTTIWPPSQVIRVYHHRMTTPSPLEASWATPLATRPTWDRLWQGGCNLPRLSREWRKNNARNLRNGLLKGSTGVYFLWLSSCVSASASIRGGIVSND